MIQARKPYVPPRDKRKPAPGSADMSSPLSPSGRWGRLSWLAWTLLLNLADAAILLIVLVFLGVLGVFGEASPATQNADSPLAIHQVAIVFLFVLFQIGITVIMVIFTIRRFHDLNLSGWWTIALVVPIVNLILLIALAALPGDEGFNSYGPPRTLQGWELIAGLGHILLISIAILAGIGAAVHAPRAPGPDSSSFRGGQVAPDFALAS